MKFKYEKDNRYFVSNDLKISFLNIPKNGSTSIRNSLSLTKRASIGSVKDSFKFAIIRNPVDRFISGLLEVSLLRDDGDPALTKSLSWYTHLKEGHYYKAVSSLLDTIENIGFYDEHFLPQKTCLESRSINNLNELDYVIHFENIEHDFKELLSKVNVKAKLVHHRRSDKKIIRILHSVVTSDEIFERLEKIYKEDFKLHKQIQNDRIN